MKLAWGPAGPEQVAALVRSSGFEINLIANAERDAPNVLMDVSEKHAGYTHVALKIQLLGSGSPTGVDPIRCARSSSATPINT